MRILSVTAQKPDSTGSGIYLTELVRGFEKMGHEQAVIAGIGRKDTMRFPDGVECFPVYFESGDLPFPIAGMSDEMPYKSTRYSDMTDVMTEQFMRIFRSQIRYAVKKFRPDVILCHHLYFLTAMAREICPGIRVYGIAHGSDIRQIKKNAWEREYIREQIRKLDGIFALHQEQSWEICECYGCHPELIEVVGTGYNSEIFCIDEERKKQKKEDKVRIIFAGKISEKKGVKSLIRSMDRVDEKLKKTGRDVELVLAGGYGDEEEFRTILKVAEECPCQIRFLGKLAQRELAAELNRSDIFVLPSFYEGLPLVVIEALACGLHTVCTDLPGIRPWLDRNIPGNGTVFVEPPCMVNEDEPLEEDLPEFEKNLADAILKAKSMPLPQKEGLEAVSWDGLCERLTELMR